MTKRSRWLALTSLAWVLTACTQAGDASGAASSAPPSAQARSALEEPQEPTFESIPTPSQLMEILSANLRDPVDTPEEEQALAAVRSELADFQYVPSAEMAAVEEEEPIGTSFAADVLSLESHLAQNTGGNLVMSCGVPPCILYGDFDGDDLKDRAVQVRGGNDQFGIFFLLASGKTALVGAGKESAIGSDTLWMLSWRRVVRQGPKYPVTDLILRGEPEEALIRLGPAGTDGTVEVQASWLIPPSDQQQ